MPIIQANKKKREAEEEFDNENTSAADDHIPKNLAGSTDPLSYISDMREHDISYTMRASIDNDLRVGAWYIVTPQSSSEVCNIDWQRDMLELCQPRVLAFDIECEKLPLKFPNAENDRIYMISYMVNY
jgi:DNA polymerase epsilon subunit 1